MDNDPQALRATRDNAAHNGVAKHIAAVPPKALPALQADVLVANILANPLLKLAPRLSALLRPGSRIALSGILSDQAEALQRRYAKWHHMAAPQQRDDWVLLHGIRRGPTDA